MKNKKIGLMIIMIFVCIIFVSGYTADSYNDIQSTLKNNYVADDYEDIISIFGSDEITDTCTCLGTENCFIDCADNCNMTLINMNRHIVLMNGTGTIYNLRNIINASEITVQGGCVANG